MDEQLQDICGGIADGIEKVRRHPLLRIFESAGGLAGTLAFLTGGTMSALSAWSGVSWTITAHVVGVLVLTFLCCLLADVFRARNLRTVFPAGRTIFFRGGIVFVDTLGGRVFMWAYNWSPFTTEIRSGGELKLYAGVVTPDGVIATDVLIQKGDTLGPFGHNYFEMRYNLCPGAVIPAGPLMLAVRGKLRAVVGNKEVDVDVDFYFRRDLNVP